jgi:hypothetical protein
MPSGHHHISILCKGMTMTPNQHTSQGSKQKCGSIGHSNKQGSGNASTGSRNRSKSDTQDQQG